MMAENDTTTTTPPPQKAGQGAKPKQSKGKLGSAAETVRHEADKAKSNAGQAIRKNASKLSDQAADKARGYAEDGKAKASGALDEFAKLMTNAAGSVDDRLGAEYGDYARSAADSIAGFSRSLEAKDIDDLLADARSFVRKSPAVAIGTAAAIGFVLARLVRSGIDAGGDASA